MSFLVSIPRKQTDSTDLARSLTRYVQCNYDSNALASHTPALNALHQMREDLRAAASQPVTEAVTDMLVQYYYQIISVETRFPISDDNLKISFTWTDIFKGRKASMCSASFERANVMFNIAMFMNQQACDQDVLGSPDMAKNASQFCMSAAGYIQQLTEYMTEHEELRDKIPDLSAEALEAVGQILLGNAQLCLFLRARSMNTKPALC